MRRASLISSAFLCKRSLLMRSCSSLTRAEGRAGFSPGAGVSSGMLESQFGNSLARNAKRQALPLYQPFVSTAAEVAHFLAFSIVSAVGWYAANLRKCSGSLLCNAGGVLNQGILHHSSKTACASGASTMVGGFSGLWPFSLLGGGARGGSPFFALPIFGG